MKVRIFPENETRLLFLIVVLQTHYSFNNEYGFCLERLAHPRTVELLQMKGGPDLHRRNAECSCRLALKGCVY